MYLARGDRDEANRLLQQALPFARGSMLARHLLHRVFGSMIVAAADPQGARAVVDQAEATLDDQCPFCSIMLFVPATIACARAGDLRDARPLLELAQRSAAREGTSWQAATTEAQAAAAEGDDATARECLHAAARAFHRAGQPLDAERCRQAAATLPTSGSPSTP